LVEHFEGFGEGEGYSTPFEVRLSFCTHIHFGQIEVVMVLLVSGLYKLLGFGDILGVGERGDGDSRGYILGLHHNDYIT